MNANGKAVAVSGIVERGMLVDLTVNRFSTGKKDREVTQVVNDQYSAEGDVGAYRKRLFPQNPKEQTAVQATANDIYALHRKLTLPWASGWRIIPREAHADYSVEMQSLRHKYEKAVKAMADALPELIDGAKDRLGKMFDQRDYPSAAAFIAAHGVSIKFMPVPDSGDFRVKLDADTMADLRSSYEADMHEYLKSATQDVWERVHATITNLSQAIERFDGKQAAEQKTTIRTAVLDNIMDLTSILPKLNLTEDEHLTDLGKEITKRLGSLKIADIKNDVATRAQAKKDADAILRKMKPFMQQPQGE
jgi:hypothetical protein